MSISEQVKHIREVEKSHRPYVPSVITEMLIEAADIIESLSAKLQAANMERQKANYSIGDLLELIDKFDNEKIKGITDFEQVQIFNALAYLDMYQKVGTINEFMELKQNKERLAADCDGGWIPCKERLPQKEETVLIDTRMGYFEIANYSGDGKTFYTEECGSSEPIAWQPLPEPYHET